MNATPFVGNQPEPLNFAGCSLAELDRKIMNTIIIPLYNGRYRALDQAANTQVLWNRLIKLRYEITAIEHLAGKMKQDQSYPSHPSDKRKT